MVCCSYSTCCDFLCVLNSHGAPPFKMCTLLAGGVMEGIHVECLDGCRLAVQLSFVLQRIVIAYDGICGIYVKGFCSIVLGVLISLFFV